MAVRKWLRRQDLEFCHEGRSELVPRWEKSIDVPGACAENEWLLSRMNEIHLTM